MDQGTLKLITEKVERTLELARILKTEKFELENVITDLRENLDEKDKEIEELKKTEELLNAEIRSMQESLNEKDAKLNEAEYALVNMIDSANKKLAEEIGSKNDYAANIGNNSQGLFN
jgi:chromosome segregation ATPase